MAGRATAVMPFDLDATTHTFVKTGSGGCRSGGPRPVRQPQHRADPVRNFADPARIHGMDMPGLRELEEGADRVDIRYEPLPAGGRITYSSSDPLPVAALHAWFGRQSSDHAMPGMGG
jgi:hypothetical protein